MTVTKRRELRIRASNSTLKSQTQDLARFRQKAVSQSESGSELYITSSSDHLHTEQDTHRSRNNVVLRVILIVPLLNPGLYPQHPRLLPTESVIPLIHIPWLI